MSQNEDDPTGQSNARVASDDKKGELDPTGPSSARVASDDEKGELDFDEVFERFSKFGDRASDGISLRNIDKWFEQANVFTNNLTTTDTAITFAKVAKNRKRLTQDEFREFLNELALSKEAEVAQMEGQLKAAGSPSFTGVTRQIRGSIAADVTERLTNPSLYTGSHKERFDTEGRGKGLSGRYEVIDDDGYVQGYKNKETYDSKENIGEDEDEDKDEDKDEDEN